MKKVTAFECTDGKRFESKREAEQHEAFLAFKADFADALKSQQPVDEVAQALWLKHVQAPAAKSKAVTNAPGAGAAPPTAPPALALAS